MKKLEGKTALITGGAQGIGKAIGHRFITEGAKVALCDINLDIAKVAARELSSDSRTAQAYFMNVTDELSVEEAVKSCVEEFGKIDILVNNAGITRDMLMIRMKLEDWNDVLGINLTGVFNVSKTVVKHMIKARSGRIINITSIVGLIGNAGQVNYSASKAGLIGMTKTMAKEFASRSITVNAVAPGFIQTTMTSHLSEEIKEAFLKSIPLNRCGSPEDVASTVTFLASEDAAYITGQVLCVDGGLVM